MLWHDYSVVLGKKLGASNDVWAGAFGDTSYTVNDLQK